jgi:poly-gamma-glutamate capsule biosynthesis protein CapA/YwtB (metallophosphatase superfamily)
MEAIGDQIVRIFMVGDVMLGRGIDQILNYQNDPRLYESYVKDAREYVKLGIRKNGPLPDLRDDDYIWGDAISELEEMKPDLRLINLETSITTSKEYCREKGIHYKMHPKNIYALKAAKIDACMLANNHVS